MGSEWPGASHGKVWGRVIWAEGTANAKFWGWGWGEEGTSLLQKEPTEAGASGSRKGRVWEEDLVES